MSDTTITNSNPSETQSSALVKDEQADFKKRAGAYLIDVAAVLIFSLICSFTIGRLVPLLGSLLSIIGLVYMVCRDCLPFLDGQSLGKKLLGLRAVTTDNTSLNGNWQPGIIRNIILLVPLIALVEAVILFTKKEDPQGLLRLGDQWAGTKVIVEK